MSKSKLSLQEQLVKSGLVSSTQAKTVKSAKHKQQQQQRKNNLQVTNEAKLLAQQTLAEKIERDRQLNQERQAVELQKQRAAQIKQLIDTHKQPISDEGIAYHFNDNNKVKTLYLSEALRDALIGGKVVIVRQDSHYALVSAEIAAKIAARDAEVIVVDNTKAEPTPQSDDPYAAYQIPDDLLW